MAMVTRRYVWQGGISKLELFLEIGATLAIPEPTYYITKDVRFDDAVASPAFVDQLMEERGWLPDAKNTIALAPLPFVGVLDAGGFVWSLQVDLLGVLTTKKVS